MLALQQRTEPPETTAQTWLEVTPAGRQRIGVSVAQKARAVETPAFDATVRIERTRLFLPKLAVFGRTRKRARTPKRVRTQKPVSAQLSYCCNPTPLVPPPVGAVRRRPPPTPCSVAFGALRVAGRRWLRRGDSRAIALARGARRQLTNASPSHRRPLCVVDVKLIAFTQSQQSCRAPPSAHAPRYMPPEASARLSPLPWGK